MPTPAISNTITSSTHRDWEEIALLYRKLEHLTGSPVVTMKRAIATAEIEGPEVGLALLDRLTLDDYRYYHATRADTSDASGATTKRALHRHAHWS